MDYETVIGLEFHVQLDCRTKMFCSCPVEFGAPPNTLVCPVCLALPGALPTLNRRAVDLGVRIAVALDAQISLRSVFARKNYFYPDLPKGYQISQYDMPLATAGSLHCAFDSGPRAIRIQRVHLEEDAGKLSHDPSGTFSLVDFNRCGVPLVEIVTGPDLRSPQEARLFMVKLRELVRQLAVSAADMEKGNFRCDANISIRPSGSDCLGRKTEIKNVNSFRFVQQALEYEQKRQISLLEQGLPVRSESRTFDAAAAVTRLMRVKETSDDYRYFPEPDLPPLVLTEEQVVLIRENLPELPDALRARLCLQYGLSAENAQSLSADKDAAVYFEQTAEIAGDARTTAHWVLGPVVQLVKRCGCDFAACPVPPNQLAELIRFVQLGALSISAAKEVLSEMAERGLGAVEAMAIMGLDQITDEDRLKALAEELIHDYPSEVALYREGKVQLLGFFVGKLMRRSRGRANPKTAKKTLRILLDAVSHAGENDIKAG